MTLIGQDRAVIWLQTNGPFSQWSPFGIGEKGTSMSGKTLPAPGRTPVYGRDRFGRPAIIKMNTEAPGDLPSATITFYERGEVDVLRKALNRGCPINVQNRIVDCGVLDNPNIWSTLDHYGNGQPTSYSPGDGPSTAYSGEAIENEVQMAFTHVIRLVATSLSSLSVGSVEDVTALAGIPDEDCGICGTGYPGADQILVAGFADGSVSVSRNGGGAWEATSAAPFTAEAVSFVAARAISKSQIRYLVATDTTDVAATAKFAYADVSLSDLTTTTWTELTIAAGAVGDVIQAAAWATFGRAYFASAGDIYVSEDQGASDPGDAIYTGAVVVNGFSLAPDQDTVWAFGATNLILREQGASGLFETRTGPSGGGAFTALAVAGDGTLFAGNGTSIYRNTDQAGGTANWEELKDFGAAKAVVAIQTIGGQRALGGDSQLLRVVVDDTTPGTGEVWMSTDGGETWFEPDEAANTGFNAAYFSEIDDNLAYIAGDDGVLMRLSA